MPLESFIFYGSLKDSDRLLAVFSKSPIEIVHGYIRGELYIVTDNTEPHGIFTYPIAVLNECGSFITAVLAVFEVEDNEQEELILRLQKYEGPLHHMVEILFYEVGGFVRRGFIFIAKDGAIEDPRVQRMASQEIYNWGA